MPTYQIITHAFQFIAAPIKGSRFIADVLPVTTPNEAMRQLKAIRTISADATHHCWAYRLYAAGQSRSSDDGEPGGSAGRPILAQIEGHSLFDVLVVVTRFYGGTKLGVGGLIRAYGGAAGKALDRVEIRSVEQTQPLRIAFAYGLTKAIDAVLRDHKMSPVQTTFEAEVEMQLAVPVDSLGHLRADLLEQTAGQIRFLP
jgi:uncharacterized YigZ family protein